jgi:hypothetical protein
MNIKKELETKETELKEIMESRSKANCVSTHQKGSDVEREMRIEDLEDEIEELKSQLK